MQVFAKTTPHKEPTYDPIERRAQLMGDTGHEHILLLDSSSKLQNKRLLVGLLDLSHDLGAPRVKALAARQHEPSTEQHLRQQPQRRPDVVVHYAVSTWLTCVFMLHAVDNTDVQVVGHGVQYPACAVAAFCCSMCCPLVQT